MKIQISLLLFALSIHAFSQNAFDPEQLNNPKSNWNSIYEQFNLIETTIYDTTLRQDNEGRSLCLIPNALRSSRYTDTENWLGTKDTVKVSAVSIVFSKYPIRKNGYKMNQKLLANRLIHLFELDDGLNIDSIEWNIVLQTHCLDDDQVNTLFHGVVVHFEMPRAENKQEVTDNQLTAVETEKEVEETIDFVDQTTPEERLNTIRYLIDDADIPEEVAEELEGKTLEEKEIILTSYLETKVDLEDADHEVDEVYIDKRKSEVDKFIGTFGYAADNTVKEVLDRNPQWKKVLVVADWTGSMYGYGAQVLDWHIENFHRSEISYFTLFNDGDRKMKKGVGETEGIYHEEADNMLNVLALYRLVMSKGGGGDGPENDLEAVLAGMDTFPEYEEIILIADNNACVRDMALLDKIDRPVHVILCGYREN